MLRLQVLGSTIAVEFGGEDGSLADLAGPWGRCRAAAPPTGPARELRADIGPLRADGPGAVLVTAPTPAELAERLTVAVTVAGIEETHRDLLLFHAGAVATGDGGVVAFVGAAGSGKTTLTRVLGRRLGYVTDETVGVREDLTVVPYPKPLSLVVPGGPKAQVGADELGLQPLPGVALRLRALVLLARDPVHEGPPTLTRPSLREVVPELFPQISYLAVRDRPLSRVRDLLEACGGIVRVVYRDAEDLVDVVPALALRVPELGPTATAGPSASPATRRLAVPSPPGRSRFARAAVVDSLRVEDDLLLLRDGRVEVLSGIAPTVWAAVEHPATSDEIVAAVVRDHGRPPQGRAADTVARGIDELLAAGLLVRVGGP